MIFTVRTEDTFIPTWNGNLDLPENEQVRVTIHLPSALDVANASSSISNRLLFEFLLYVKKIENLKAGEAGKEEQVTAEGLFHTEGLHELVSEIRAYYLQYLNVNKKKLESGSDSSTKEGPRSKKGGKKG